MPGYNTVSDIFSLRRNWRFLLVFFIITFIGWFDDFIVSENSVLSDKERQMTHVFALLAIVAIEYVVWRRHPVRWLVKVWLAFYSLIFILLFITGVYLWFIGDIALSGQVMIVSIRKYFCGPLPFLLFYLISLIGLKAQMDKQA